MKKKLLITLASMLALQTGVAFADTPHFNSFEEAHEYVEQGIMEEGKFEGSFILTNDVIEEKENQGEKLIRLVANMGRPTTYYNFINAMENNLILRTSEGQTKTTLRYNFYPFITKGEDNFVQQETDKIALELLKDENYNHSKVGMIRGIKGYMEENFEHDFSIDLEQDKPNTLLKEGVGSDTSFSLITSLLLEKVGIENEIIIGHSRKTEEMFIWLMVEIDGEWFHLDIPRDVYLKNDDWMDRSADRFFSRSLGISRYSAYHLGEEQKVADSKTYTHLNFVPLDNLENRIEELDQKVNGTKTENVLELNDDSFSPWAEKEIIHALENNLLNENLLGGFQNDITREEFAELVVNLYYALGGEEVNNYNSTFIDTENESVLKASALNVINGVGGNRFGPQSSVTREQVATMFTRLLDVLDIKPMVLEKEVYFADSNEISEWAVDSVYTMNKLGIINGVGENRIDPKGTTSKEQAIALAVRVLEQFNI